MLNTCKCSLRIDLWRKFNRCCLYQSILVNSPIFPATWLSQKFIRWLLSNWCQHLECLKITKWRIDWWRRQLTHLKRWSWILDSLILVSLQSLLGLSWNILLRIFLLFTSTLSSQASLASMDFSLSHLPKCLMCSLSRAIWRKILSYSMQHISPPRINSLETVLHPTWLLNWLGHLLLCRNNKRSTILSFLKYLMRCPDSSVKHHSQPLNS